MPGPRLFRAWSNDRWRGLSCFRAEWHQTTLRNLLLIPSGLLMYVPLYSAACGRADRHIGKNRPSRLNRQSSRPVLFAWPGLVFAASDHHRQCRWFRHWISCPNAQNGCNGHPQWSAHIRPKTSYSNIVAPMCYCGHKPARICRLQSIQQLPALFQPS